MANEAHLAILRQGVEAWNRWRFFSPGVIPDLSKADLSKAELREANFSEVDFHQADLSRANFRQSVLSDANLSGAILIGADLREANLGKANLIHVDLSHSAMARAYLKEANLVLSKLGGADLTAAELSHAVLRQADLTETILYQAILNDTDLEDAILDRANMNWTSLSNANLRNTVLRNANLGGANLIHADFVGADLTSAILSQAHLIETNMSRAILTDVDMSGASLIGTNLTRAVLTDSRIYGVSVWNLILEDTKQDNLIITDESEPMITVDNLEIAQFIYLLLHNEKLRDVIDTITTKVVLILGRFTEERKAVLDAMRSELRKRDYVPIMFDFEKPSNRDITETVMTLAGMARFVIADLSDPHSIPHELMSFAETLLSVPVQPIFCAVDAHPRAYPMFEHLQRYSHVLPIQEYKDDAELLAALSEKVIDPAEKMVTMIRKT